MGREEKDCQALLGRNIRRFRGQLGLSQLDLALELGMSLAFLSDIETGKKWVSPKTLTKLANAFRVEVYQLFKPDGQEAAPEPIQPEIAGEVGKYLDNVDAVLAKHIAHSVRPFLERTVERSLARIERSVAGAVGKMRKRYDAGGGAG